MIKVEKKQANPSSPLPILTLTNLDKHHSLIILESNFDQLSTTVARMLYSPPAQPDSNPSAKQEGQDICDNKGVDNLLGKEGFFADFFPSYTELG